MVGSVEVTVAMVVVVAMVATVAVATVLAMGLVAVTVAVEVIALGGGITWEVSVTDVSPSPQVQLVPLRVHRLANWDDSAGPAS